MVNISLKELDYSDSIRPKDTDITDLINSIKDIGIRYPIEVYQKRVISGTLRCRAAEKLGLKTVPCKILNNTDFERLWHKAQIILKS